MRLLRLAESYLGCTISASYRGSVLEHFAIDTAKDKPNNLIIFNVLNYVKYRLADCNGYKKDY